MSVEPPSGDDDQVYFAPVADLLDLDGVDEYDDCDYAEMGITREHIPELIRMVKDPVLALKTDGSGRPIAPTHAWRALCQLDAFEAITPLLEWFDVHSESNEDWFWGELAWSLLELGGGAAAPLNAWLQKEPPTRLASEAAAFGLGEVGKWDEDARPGCVAGLVASLERFANHAPEFNACLIMALVEVRAVNAVPLIRQVIKAGAVEEDMIGSWEELKEAIHSPFDLDDCPDIDPDDAAPRGPEFAKNVTGSAGVDRKFKSGNLEPLPALTVPTAVKRGYLPPVASLFLLGFEKLDVDLNYIGIFGFSEADLPQLIRLGTDVELLKSDDNDDAPFAPLHAWRALGALGAVGAVRPLMGLFNIGEGFINDDEYEILQESIAEIGPAALDPLAECLFVEPFGNMAALEAAGMIGLFAEESPGHRDFCVSKLLAALEQYGRAPGDFNGALILELTMLKAAEARSLMEAAYHVGAVATDIAGTWDDVQIAFGWKEAPEQSSRQAGFKRPTTERDVPYDFDVPKPIEAPPAPGRNDPCPCGSGKKYKKCCG